MMPQGIHSQIRKVEIYHNGRCILGFKFFDKKNTFLFEIGDTTNKLMTEVVIEENEQIIGVKAKLYPG